MVSQASWKTLESAPLSAFGSVEMIPLYTIHAEVQERLVHHWYSSTVSSIQLCFYCSGRVFGLIMLKNEAVANQIPDVTV